MKQHLYFIAFKGGDRDHAWTFALIKAESRFKAKQQAEEACGKGWSVYSVEHVEPTQEILYLFTV